jgi:hypothetical protein
MEPYKVRLKQANGAVSGSNAGTLKPLQVVFDASPEISESGTANYKLIDPVHAPGSILVFTSASARTFQVSGIKLFSRNGVEATKNYDRIQKLKAWRYPVFGLDSTDAIYGNPLLGAPPAVLEFTAYGKPNGNAESGMATALINRVPVVITNIGIDYPSDVDYLPTIAVANDDSLKHIPSGIPVPAIWTVSITLMEAHSPSQYQKFSITDFRKGILDGF